MESKFRVLGHGAHPILIVFPLGLLGGSVIFDIIYLVTGTTTFSFVAYWLIITGIIGGVVAAVPGFVDWFAIPKNTRAKSVGLIHGIGNDVVLLLFALSWWLRYDNRPFHVPSTAALAVSFAGFALALFTGSACPSTKAHTSTRPTRSQADRRANAINILRSKIFAGGN
jgi:uncharacterized membrane protein